jgi:hypothetical protein
VRYLCLNLSAINPALPVHLGEWDTQTFKMAEGSLRYVVIGAHYVYITKFSCDRVSSSASLDVIGVSVLSKALIVMFYVNFVLS